MSHFIREPVVTGTTGGHNLIPFTSHRNLAAKRDQQTPRPYPHHHPNRQHHHHVGTAGARGIVLPSVMQVGRLIRHISSNFTCQ